MTSNQRPSSVARRLSRISLFFILTITVIGGGVFAYLYSTSPSVRDVLSAYLSRSASPGKAFPGRNEITLLLMGRDLDRDNHGRIVHTRGRTDCMMLARLDFDKKTMNILSIPRDTLVHIPGYRGKRRISYANSFGGPDLAQATVQDFLGVQPDYYLLVNFEGFVKAVDSIGGLKVTVDKQLDYDDNWGNLHIHLKPGLQQLNGYQAMGFARYRHSNNGGGDSDFVRIGRQQEILRATREKLCTPRCILKVPKVIDTIRSDMEGNLTPSQMICLAHFLKSLPQGDGITMETLPALDESGIYVRADLDATRELVQRMFP